MKKLSFLVVIAFSLLLLTFCKKDEFSERFMLLTTPVWTSDSLLANGDDASGPGEVLEDFKGDAKFNKDKSGYFGDYTGRWWFEAHETLLVIDPDADTIPIYIYCNLVELTELSLKITASVPNKDNPFQALPVRMTFKVK
ncbi:MAG: hypothetical protein MUF36_09385 [Bacteroidales bacterium]|jgi:hypothetical protein|nr:hypothetical protein [Bacteroidales bacterium]